MRASDAFHALVQKLAPPMLLAPMIVMAGFRNHADTMTTSAHHQLHDKKSITESSPSSTSAPVEQASHVDRYSAIALSVILCLILVAVAWFLYLHITHKRQAADLERQTTTTTTTTTTAAAAAAETNTNMGRITWRRSASAGTVETTGRPKSNSVFKHIPHPHFHRKDSVTTTAQGDHHTDTDRTSGETKRRWPSLSLWQSHDSEATTLAPNTASDCPSIYADTIPFSSDERPTPTHLFRLQSRKTFPEQSSPPAQFRLQTRKTFPEISHPVAQSRLQSRKSFADPPIPPKSRSQTTLPRRNSSLSQSQYDKQWWSEVGRRGSATAATRRLSVLEPVLEHEVRSRSCESKKPSKPEPSKQNDRGSSRRRSSTHASWEGSRCESVMYDWTRPTDEEVQSKSAGKMFKGVDWNQGSDSVRGRQQERTDLVESRDDSVYRMDWALKM